MEEDLLNALLIVFHWRVKVSTLVNRHQKPKNVIVEVFTPINPNAEIKGRKNAMAIIPVIALSRSFRNIVYFQVSDTSAVGHALRQI